MMDISPEYIAMCDCPEIQKGHVDKTGDLFANKWFIGVYIRDESYIYEVEDSPKREQRINNPIWLPRQDQLQEMVGGFEAGFVDWFHWRNAIYPHMQNPFNKEWRFTSMEQLWLAFVMKENHNKTWDGNKWVT